MGKRSTSRRIAMQALFQAEHSGEDVKRAINDIAQNGRFVEETINFAKLLAEKTFKQRAELDQLIKKQLAPDWSLNRLSGVDRNILRLVLCELRDFDTPERVVINEALNLAQKYSSSKSAKFINGVVGAYLKGEKNVD